MDVEDIGGLVGVVVRRPAASEASGDTTSGAGTQALAAATAPREMVTPLQRKSLVKEGYKVRPADCLLACLWRGGGGSEGTAARESAPHPTASNPVCSRRACGLGLRQGSKSLRVVTTADASPSTRDCA